MNSVQVIRNNFTANATNGDYADCLKMMLDNPEHSVFSKNERVKFVNFVEQHLDGTESDNTISKRILLLNSLLDPENFKKKIQSMYENNTLPCFSSAQKSYHRYREDCDEITIQFLVDSDLLPDLKDDDKDSYTVIIDNLCNRDNSDKLRKVESEGQIDILIMTLLKRQKFLLQAFSSGSKEVQDACKLCLGVIRSFYHNLYHSLSACADSLGVKSGLKYGNLQNYSDEFVKNNLEKAIDKSLLLHIVNFDAEHYGYKAIFTNYCLFARIITNFVGDDLLKKMKENTSWTNINSVIEDFLVSCIEDKNLVFLEKFIDELNYNRVSKILRHVVAEPLKYFAGTIPILLKGKPRKFHESFVKLMDASKETATNFLDTYKQDTTTTVTQARASATCLLHDIELLYSYHEGKASKKVKV